MPEAGTPPSTAPKVPPFVVLGDAKVTIDAPMFKVFGALTTPEELAAWSGEGAVVEADVGGRYETLLPTGRVEGTITAIDGPRHLAFTWPFEIEGTSVSTSVHVDLSPKGSGTAVHVAHRSPRPVPGDWSALWQSVLNALKAHVEGIGAETW